MKSNASLAVLFGGEQIQAKLVDGTMVDCFVRAMPQRAMADVMARAEDQSALIELCVYLDGDPSPDAPAPRYRLPIGRQAVPAGWADNLTPESFDLIWEAATRLNFSVAVIWARRQIAAKKTVGPVFEATVQQITPLVNRMVQPLLAQIKALSDSAQKPQSSSVSPEKPS
jgi:hypothetical protein